MAAQGVLATLGLTEASARKFLFDELRSESAGHRRSDIAVAGHRAFYKLPPSARGPAATVLFAWAKAYVNSQAFKTAYAEFRRSANPLDTRAVPTPDEQIASQMAEMKAGLELMRKVAETMPPAERDRLLATVKEQEAQMPALLERIRSAIAVEQSERKASNQESASRFEERYPANPNRLAARRIREFLDETADADFTARIIRLTDGPDGMEFMSPAHRAKPSTWQLAVLAGREATTAARGAAESMAAGDRTMTPLDRRQALALLLSMPLAERAAAVARAQTTATARHRVAFSQGHGLLIEPDGTVQLWLTSELRESDRGYAVLGLGPDGALPPYTLARVPGLTDVVAAAAGAGFSAALLGNGTVMTWGQGLGGALGRTAKTRSETDPTPALVPGVKGVRRIVAGGSHLLALTEAGTIVVWGQPDFGALGRGDAAQWAPGPIPRLAGVQSIAAHGSTSMAVLASGRIMTWGEVRPWTRPPEEGPWDNISRRPILLWVDGLEQP